MRSIPVLGIAIAAFIAAPALAASSSYLDDRSSASALVRSFYNAVNQQQYSRAYTYFGDGAAPTSYSEFVKGYANTASVRVVTGKETNEGAAGSTYYTVPVAIDAASKDGSHKQFAGCYTTRLVQPAAQDPPVKPMFISKATLQPAHGSNLRSLLPACPD